MILFIAYTVAAFGLAYVLGHSVPTRALREWAWSHRHLQIIVMLIECPACCGFWIGLFCGITYFRDLFWGLFTALFTCGANYALARATNLTPPAHEHVSHVYLHDGGNQHDLPVTNGDAGSAVGGEKQEQRGA